MVRQRERGVPVLPDSSTLAESLQDHVLVLDGGMGTELECRGVPTRTPLWSATALVDPEYSDETQEIHRNYVSAGADIITANTFRTNVRTLIAADVLTAGETLNRLAVQLARGPSTALRPLDAAFAWRDRFVVASVAPVEDCYSPQCVPEEAALDAEHGQMMTWLKAAEPDAIWIETMNTVREARAAARAAAAAEMLFIVSFVLREDGSLLSGESLKEAVAAVEPFGPIALGLNCIPPDGITAHLPRLRQLTDLPRVAYAHINNTEPTPGWSFSQEATPAQYARQVSRWLDIGASIVGGCCGTTPAHIRAVRNLVDRRRGP
jgi:S-methylmethionine-dependent homocysteine/selenocysteine methylase